MRILFVSNVVPNSAGGGSPRRAALHLEALRHLGEVTLILPPVEGLPLPDIAGLTVYERDYSLVDIRAWRQEGSKSRLKQPYHRLRRPNHVDARALPEDVARFRRLLAVPFDLVFVFRLRSVIWLESVLGEKLQALRVVDLDDIESRVFEKKIEFAAGPWWQRAKYRRELRWLRLREKHVSRNWHAVCLCSRLDADRFQQSTGSEPWIIPNAYRFGPISTEKQDLPIRLLFVGTFSYFPNAEGIIWFVESIWPKVRAALGEGVELILAGLQPTPDIMALSGCNGIRVAGDVPSVEPFYDAANIVIAPLRAGSGTRIKLIEAAAKGRAIVTTTLGCEGLGFVDGVHVEMADEPTDFAARIIELARDNRRRQELAQACYQHAEALFSEDRVIADLRRRIRELMSEIGRGPSRRFRQPISNRH